MHSKGGIEGEEDSLAVGGGSVVVVVVVVVDMFGETVLALLLVLAGLEELELVMG